MTKCDLSHLVTYYWESQNWTHVCVQMWHILELQNQLQICNSQILPNNVYIICYTFEIGFHKAIWEMTDRDVILTPILCMEVTKSSGNKLERFGKNWKNVLLKLTEGRGAWNKRRGPNGWQRRRGPNGWQLHIISVFIQFWTIPTAK